VADVARLDEEKLVAMLGRAAGRQLHALAQNRDPRRVRPGRRRGSIGSQRALGRSYRGHEHVEADLIALVERVTRRLRAAERIGRTVVLRLRFDDFTRATRSLTLPQATAETQQILTTAQTLLSTVGPTIEQRGLTLIGIAVANLANDRPLQLRLPFDVFSDGALDAALDEIRRRYGSSAVTRGVLVGRSEGLAMPLLPD
jgi:DNA polymerase-4